MNDKVNHPKHYTSHPSGIEAIEITQYYNFCIGNAIKYLWRAGLKDEEGMESTEKQVQDLKKAVWYINREIDNLNKGVYNGKIISKQNESVEKVGSWSGAYETTMVYDAKNAEPIVISLDANGRYNQYSTVTTSGGTVTLDLSDGARQAALDF